MRKTHPLFSAAVFGAVLLAAMLAGCRSQAWYEERAVNRAREFLLENAPELSVEQRAFVRYNQPVLLVASIFGGTGPAISDASHICVTWVIPGESEAYLVFGVSDIRMESWYPNRLIRKTFENKTKKFFAAVGTARKYVQNGLFYDLSSHEFNCVRFEMPRLYRTDFELALDPDGTADEKALALRRQLTQFSLVWAPRDQEPLVVVNGLAKPDLSGFSVYGGGLTSPETLKKHTLEILPPMGVSGAAAEGAKRP